MCFSTLRSRCHSFGEKLADQKLNWLRYQTSLTWSNRENKCGIRTDLFAIALEDNGWGPIKISKFVNVFPSTLFVFSLHSFHHSKWFVICLDSDFLANNVCRMIINGPGINRNRSMSEEWYEKLEKFLKSGKSCTLKEIWWEFTLIWFLN